MELKLGVGIGPIKFGMQPEEVLSILGEPDAKRYDEQADEQYTWYWEYYEHQLRLAFFEGDNNRLKHLYSISPKLTYNGHEIMYQDAAKVKKEIFGNVIKDWIEDVYISFTISINDEQGLALYTDFGIITQVEIDMPFEEDGESIWTN